MVVRAGQQRAGERPEGYMCERLQWEGASTVKDFKKSLWLERGLGYPSKLDFSPHVRGRLEGV
jgi:hypothetical protein